MQVFHGDIAKKERIVRGKFGDKAFYSGLKNFHVETVFPNSDELNRITDADD